MYLKVAGATQCYRSRELTRGESLLMRRGPVADLARRRCKVVPAGMGLLALVAACGGDRDPQLPTVSSSCVSQTASRWSVFDGSPSFIGDLGTDGRSGAVVGDSILFVYERLLAQVSRFEVSGQPHGSFGREGRGPGELAARGGAWALPHGVVSWIDAVGDTVAVFDGSAVHMYDVNGRYLQDIGAPGDSLRGDPRFSKRMRLLQGGVLVDVEERGGASRTAGPERRRYSIWWVGHRGATRVVTLWLPPLPARHQGSGDAQPLWDLVGGCVVVSDGSSPWLLVAQLDGARVDTLPIPLPARTVPESSEDAAMLRRLGVNDRRSPSALPLRIYDLVADPDGWVWILPVQPPDGIKGGLEVLRVPIGHGEAVIDTAFAFPRAFGPEGTVYGTRRDREGLVRLARFPGSGSAGQH